MGFHRSEAQSTRNAKFDAQTHEDRDNENADRSVHENVHRSPRKGCCFLCHRVTTKIVKKEPPGKFNSAHENIHFQHEITYVEICFGTKSNFQHYVISTITSDIGFEIYIGQFCLCVCARAGHNFCLGRRKGSKGLSSRLPQQQRCPIQYLIDQQHKDATLAPTTSSFLIRYVLFVVIYAHRLKPVFAVSLLTRELLNKPGSSGKRLRSSRRKALLCANCHLTPDMAATQVRTGQIVEGAASQSEVPYAHIRDRDHLRGAAMKPPLRWSPSDKLVWTGKSRLPASNIRYAAMGNRRHTRDLS